VEKFFQDYQGEPNDMVRRILQLSEPQETREKLLDKAHDHHQKIKQSFEKKSREKDFQLGDLVLKCDALRQDKGKHGKLKSLSVGPLNIFEAFSNNTYRLQNLEGDEVFGGPINGHFLKKKLFKVAVGVPPL
jgi:hypothetical protein